MLHYSRTVLKQNGGARIIVIIKYTGSGGANYSHARVNF